MLRQRNIKPEGEGGDQMNGGVSIGRITRKLKFSFLKVISRGF